MGARPSDVSPARARCLGPPRSSRRSPWLTASGHSARNSIRRFMSSPVLTDRSAVTFPWAGNSAPATPCDGVTACKRSFRRWKSPPLTLAMRPTVSVWRTTWRGERHERHGDTDGGRRRCVGRDRPAARADDGDDREEPRPGRGRRRRCGPDGVDEALRALRPDPRARTRPGLAGTTTHRECIAVWRQRRRVTLLPDPNRLELIAEEHAVEPPVETLDRDVQLRAAVANLPDIQRAIVGRLMSEVEPSYSQVASELGIPIGSIGPTRRRCLKALHARCVAASIRLG